MARTTLDPLYHDSVIYIPCVACMAARLWVEIQTS